MTHWMEGDWPENCEVENDEDIAIKKLLGVARSVLKRWVITNDEDDNIANEFELAILDVEAIYESDDPLENGWVGDDGLP